LATIAESGSSRHSGTRTGLRSSAAVAVFWVLALQPVGATVPDDLYRVEIAVADQSRAEQQAASALGLLEVLTRVTGLKDIPHEPEVRAALAQPERYYTQSLYLAGAGPELQATPRAQSMAGEPQSGEGLRLSLRFSETEIRRLIMTAGLPLWSTTRPTTVVWLAIDDGERRQLIDGADEEPLPAALRLRARQRALPLIVPELADHLDGDRTNISVFSVWTHDWDALVPVSERYRMDNILVGRISESPTAGWVTDWRLWQRTGERTHLEKTFVVETDDVELLGREAVDRVADEMFARFAIYPGAEAVLRLEISGVVDLAGYGAVLEYLGALEFVETVQVERVQRGTLNVTLITHADATRMQEFLDFDGRLRPVAPADPLRRVQPGLVRLEWHG
jgi:uncharacterized protein